MAGNVTNWPGRNIGEVGDSGTVQIGLAAIRKIAMNESQPPASVAVCPSCRSAARPTMVTVGDQLRTVRWVCTSCGRGWNVTEPDYDTSLKPPA